MLPRAGGYLVSLVYLLMVFGDFVIQLMGAVQAFLFVALTDSKMSILHHLVNFSS